MVHSSHFTCLPLHPSKKKMIRALPSTADSMVYSGSGSISTVQNKNSIVRIVFSTGMTEIYDSVISAYSVMQKYPRLCLARPEIFKKPHDSLVGPKELLYPGQKFLFVPKTTVMKLLQQNDSQKTEASSEDIKLEKVETEVVKVEKVENEEREGDDEGVSSAKDFYVSNDKWSRCSIRRLEIEKQEEKPSNPPIMKMRMRKKVLGGWKPSLTSIEETSP